MTTTTADVLIVGGGLMGCATAREAATSGARVVLVERNAAPGTETTARSGAIIRAHYGVPELVTLAVQAARRYADFKAETGHDIGWNACGYSVVVDENDARVLADNVAMQQSLGARVEMLSPAELKALVPSLQAHDIALACYEPDAGYANPAKTVAAFCDLARECGADLRFDSVVTKAEREGESWRVTLQNGEAISAAQVVLCTGNWSAPVGKLFGLDLPVVPVRAQIVVLQRPDSFRGSFPVVSDLIHLAYFREDGAGAMWVGSSDMNDLSETLPAPENFCEEADESAIAAARCKAALRFDGMNESAVERAFCGLYETTPDWQPIIDSFEGVHVAVGFSGHGFKLAPVVGQEMAHRALHGNSASTRSPFSDATAIFDLARFDEKRLIKSRHAYQRAKFLR